ncbi:helix-turn-helix domain-containing protein, partial [Candidatus Dojkabacteria bacterium]|nr:helix-turn-helix domain-containing protein [Candidatus Dojkabacteria bacterium]
FLEHKSTKIHYLNYINLPNSEENYVLLEVMNAILKSFGYMPLQMDQIDDPYAAFSIFKAGVNMFKSQKMPNKQDEIFIVFDEFHRCKNYSNSFFFTLDKILSIQATIPEIIVTSALISDEYLNPYHTKAYEGMNKLFSHFFNFFIIPAYSEEELLKLALSKYGDRYSHELLLEIYAYTGGNPALFFALSDSIEAGVKMPSEQSIFENYEIEWKLHESWESIGEINQTAVLNSLLKKRYSISNRLQRQFLEDTKIILPHSNKIGIPVLEKYIQRTILPERQTHEDYIQIGVQTIDLHELTPSLDKLLRVLAAHKDRVVTRDDIASAIWGDKHLDKYSDYAIDKQISKLRKFLVEKGLSSKYIETKKGKGYILRTSI